MTKLNSNEKIDQTAKMLPNSFESEQAVLCCALIDGEAIYQIVSKLYDEDFYHESHKIIFRAIKKIYDNLGVINYITVSDMLEKDGDISKVGGMVYISSLTRIVPSAAGCNNYIDIVKRDSILRQVISICNNTLQKAYDKNSSNEVLGETESEIFKLSEKGQSSALKRINEPLEEVVNKIEEIHKDPTILQGLRTGFPGLDRRTNGLQKSDLIILAARPGIGKTSLAMNIVANASIKSKAKCAVFSFEMSEQQLLRRMLFSVAGVSMAKGIRGELDSAEWTKLWKAKEKLDKAEIYIDDNSANTPSQILSKCRKLKREKGLDLVVIDYLGLIKSDGNDSQFGRQAEVAKISQALKGLAKEVNVPVISLCQLNRSVDIREDGKPGRPVLSDLRESGSIEQDADMVWFIHRDREDTQENGEKKENYTVELIIAKFRNGQSGSVFLGWDGSRTTFTNLGKDAEEQSLIDEVSSNTKNLYKETIQNIQNETKNDKQSDENIVDDVPFDEKDIPPEQNDEQNTPPEEFIKDFGNVIVSSDDELF